MRGVAHLKLFHPMRLRVLPAQGSLRVDLVRVEFGCRHRRSTETAFPLSGEQKLMVEQEGAAPIRALRSEFFYVGG